MQRPILVYRDRLLPSSEVAFMRRQYCAFERLRPVWTGCHRDAGLNAAGIEPLILGGSGPAGGLARGLFKQFGIVPGLAELKALGPALVHAQFGRGGALALPLAKALGVPLVVTFHGGDAFKEKHYRPTLAPSIFRRRWPELLSYAALIVCVSAAVRDKLVERGAPPAKLEVIHIGSDDLAADLAPRREKHFLFAGRFVPKKGIFVLVEAIRALRQRGVTTPVLLAGDGPLMGEIRGLTRDLAGVEFAGWLNAEQMKAALEEAVAMVVPSIAAADGDREGLPSVAAEAMGRGVPVIASDQTGLAEMLEASGAGLAVAGGDASALAEAMARLAGDAALRAVAGAAAHRLALAELCAPRQSRRLEERLLGLL